MNKLFSKRTLVRIFSVLCVVLLSLSVVPRIYRAHASGFTVSNVTFDPATGVLDFDYTGDNLTNDFYMEMRDASTVTTAYWFVQGGACTSSHCHYSLASSASDSGVTSVKFFSRFNGVDETSQSLNYPLPLPTTNTPQTPTVGGWINTGETWTYASANSFTISGVDETSIYTPGTRIKATNNSTTFYGTVASSSFSTNTTVTLIANSDYSLANSAITKTYYSFAANPAGYPGWFNYTPTWSGFSSNPTSVVSRFNVVNRLVTVEISSGGGGTSNSTSFSLTLPVAAAQHINVAGLVDSYDNGSHVADPGVAVTNSGSTTLNLYTSTSQAGWTASGQKGSNFTISYEM